jgi:oxygen-independent coproporphyrinogen-3 oxidase
MAGIYLHIPFCKQACHYCNFHFSTSLRFKDDMVAALIRELELRSHYLNGAALESIYFGGGTPSLLSVNELQQILNKISQLHPVSSDAEITLETNPDDLTKDYLLQLADSPVNRLSIGIQSFVEEDLRFMNRAHNTSQAYHCLELAKQSGFDNITADLIYGSPTTSDEQWEHNIQTLLQFDVPHLSCYCLTVEPGTALAHFVKKGKVQPVDELKAARQFEILIDRLEGAGFLHYEISNFARPGYLAKHNSNYWRAVPYLGIGPSAHSYNGISRQWNLANNAKYLKAIAAGNDYYETEVLSLSDQYNEYVMTSLRTTWGCDLAKVRQINSKYSNYFVENIQAFIEKEEVREERDIFRLTKAGKLMADHIAASLFWLEE